MTFKNKHFTKRDYECTNIVACVSDKPIEAGEYGEVYVPADDSILNGLTMLYIQAGVQYYGYL